MFDQTKSKIKDRLYRPVSDLAKFTVAAMVIAIMALILAIAAGSH
jgi:hypothetical protein